MQTIKIELFVSINYGSAVLIVWCLASWTSCQTCFGRKIELKDQSVGVLIYQLQTNDDFFIEVFWALLQSKLGSAFCNYSFGGLFHKIPWGMPAVRSNPVVLKLVNLEVSAHVEGEVALTTSVPWISSSLHSDAWGYVVVGQLCMAVRIQLKKSNFEKWKQEMCFSCWKVKARQLASTAFDFRLVRQEQEWAKNFKFTKICLNPWTKVNNNNNNNIVPKVKVNLHNSRNTIFMKVWFCLLLHKSAKRTGKCT